MGRPLRMHWRHYVRGCSGRGRVGPETDDPNAVTCNRCLRTIAAVAAAEAREVARLAADAAVAELIERHQTEFDELVAHFAEDAKAPLVNEQSLPTRQTSS
jgi:hypothetical protein